MKILIRQEYLSRFARDDESTKMFKLITDFFLNELKLDFVTKEEIEHMIGVLLTNGFENDHDDSQAIENTDEIFSV